MVKVENLVKRYGTNSALNDVSVEIGEGRVLKFDSERFVLSYDRVENKCLPYDDLNIQSCWGVECLWDLKLTSKFEECKAVFVIE